MTARYLYWWERAWLGLAGLSAVIVTLAKVVT